MSPRWKRNGFAPPRCPSLIEDDRGEVPLNGIRLLCVEDSTNEQEDGWQMANKSVLIVYQKKRHRAARRWELAISRADGHKASLNSDKVFKQRQFEVPSTQPVVFVGLSKPARDIMAVCPKVFSEWGATCRLSGRRVVVTCEWPIGLDESDASAQAKKVATAIQDYTGSTVGFELASEIPDLRQINRDRHARRDNDNWAKQSKWMISRYSGADSATNKARERSVRHQYVELLYVYAAARFVAEQLDEFAAA